MPPFQLENGVFYSEKYPLQKWRYLRNARKFFIKLFLFTQHIFRRNPVKFGFIYLTFGEVVVHWGQAPSLRLFWS